MCRSSIRQLGRHARMLLAFVLLAACSPYRATDNPAPPVAVPERFVAESGAEPAAPRFWESFGQPGLNQLVDAAVTGNFTLQAAWARLGQADAVATIAGAPRWPTLDASANGRVQRQVLAFTPPGGDNSTIARSFNMSLAASYEVDLWNRIGSGARAASFERDAVRDDLERAAITIASEVTERWFDLSRVLAMRALLNAQLEANERFLAIVTARFDAGQASGLDVSQQRQMVAGSRARLQLSIANEVTLRHQLAVLAGKVPGTLTIDASAQLPSLPPLPSAGVPSELLKHRPDVRAAQRRVAAADHRVAEAVADRYPALRLSGDVSAQAQRSDFVSQALTPLWNLIAGLTAPIFDGNRRASEVDRRDAVLAERLSDYGQTLLTALMEVENALVQERQQNLYIEQLAAQALAASDAVEQSRVRYESGLTDFLPVLTSISAAQANEQLMLDAQRQLISFRVQLGRALGGVWTSELQAAQ